MGANIMLERTLPCSFLPMKPSQQQPHPQLKHIYMYTCTFIRHQCKLVPHTILLLDRIILCHLCQSVLPSLFLYFGLVRALIFQRLFLQFSLKKPTGCVYNTIHNKLNSALCTVLYKLSTLYIHSTHSRIQ